MGFITKAELEAKGSEMALTDEQMQAEANLVVAYPAGVGFDVVGAADSEAMERTIGVFDELVDLGRAVVVTEHDDPQLSCGRGYRLSDAAAEAHRQVIELQSDQADLN